MEFDKDKVKGFATTTTNWMKQNGRVVWGGLSVLLGALLLLRSRELLIHLLVFLLGFVLVYYGLHLLNATRITGFIDSQLRKLKERFLK